MSDKDQDNISQNDLSDNDDLDSLSSEEKAAFEKIMAEISIATGETPQPDATVAPSQQASEAPASEDPSPSPDESAEASPETPIDPSPEATSDDPGEDPDTLSNDQQEALDKIMSEIDSKRKSETKESAPEADSKSESESHPDDDPLPDDQQDALDQIMAEIDSKRNADRTEPVDPPESQSDDEPLAEDQQDALDKIMAEIQAKKDRPEVPEQMPDEDPEVSSGEGQNPKDPEDQGDLGDQRDGADPDNLTIDEFDNELSNLLSSANDKGDAAAEEPTPDAIPETSPDPEAESGIQDSQPESEEPSESETVQAPEKSDADIPLGDLEPELHEVTTDIPDPPSNRRFFKGAPQTMRLLLKLVAVMILAALCLSVMVLGGYTGYIKIKHWRQTDTDARPAPALATMEATPHGEPKLTGQPFSTVEANQVQQGIVKDAGHVPGFWADDLITARNHIQKKISEIQSLKEYYRNGIDEDIQKIAPIIALRTPTFEAAMADKNIDLAVRSIQRRTTYIAKLEVPLTALGVMAEELLFLERRAHLHDTLSQGISGLPKIDLQNQITLALENYDQYSNGLSIDDIEVVAPDMKNTWQEILGRISRKTQRISKQTPLNNAISAEICKGNFDRNFMLTVLAPETARCLINWNGKDLYLNELTELSTETARILVQWPGEWLSLNGLKTLSADTAKVLAQWPGKRLSLNGLSILSADTTANLSQWKGSQLEMIGLQTIGSWENYGTRLFLSENLRRRLDIQ